MPYAKINQLGDDPTKVITKIGIYTHSNERTELLINELSKITTENGIISLNKIHDSALNLIVKVYCGAKSFD